MGTRCDRATRVLVAGVMHLYVANNLRRALLGARLDADEKRVVLSGGPAGAPPSMSSRHAATPRPPPPPRGLLLPSPLHAPFVDVQSGSSGWGDQCQ